MDTAFSNANRQAAIFVLAFVASARYAATKPMASTLQDNFVGRTRSLPANGLAEAAQALVRALEGAGDQRSEYWQHRVQPYLKSIWPKSRAAVTPDISESFARLAVAAQFSFPDALDTLRHWLQAIEHPDFIVHLINETRLSDQFPKSVLEFLNIVIGDATQWPPTHLADCLRTIRDVDPNLADDGQFIRLADYLRRWTPDAI
ncbi:hypothetical protein [Collimonas antrihumi]|uniref:hypothetical protein n=1 Tax=Collimonas antrihumi TaxID=1940615 RepID=UPI001B8CF0A6|nr:hypothetical protein [Collimonas antrihumi]